MDDAESTTLKAEIAELRKELAELKQCSYQHFELFTTHQVDLYREIGDLFSYLMPIIRKIYPGFTEADRQINDWINRRGARGADNDPQKKR